MIYNGNRDDKDIKDNKVVAPLEKIVNLMFGFFNNLLTKIAYKLLWELFVEIVVGLYDCLKYIQDWFLPLKSSSF